ncbi:helix-turn-helix domain-containing protein [Novosphingobium sp.]|uniref:TetR/AcrR family transcriptional regulator n=1 Tax=Novosphingobium sp. TaxID=1874826 RepID=UPI003342B417
MSNVSSSSPNLRRMLDAGLTLFARHGFKRTSMADIAREAGIARATLYLHFPDKRAVFAALAASVIDDALAAAETAWDDHAALADNLAATILAKDLRFFRLLRTTPHGAELFDLDAGLTLAEADRLDRGFSDLLIRRAAAAAAQGADLAAFGGPAEFAAFLSVTAAGIKYETRTEDDYRAAIHRLVRVTAAAASKAAMPSAG